MASSRERGRQPSSRSERSWRGRHPRAGARRPVGRTVARGIPASGKSQQPSHAQSDSRRLRPLRASQVEPTGLCATNSRATASATRVGVDRGTIWSEKRRTVFPGSQLPGIDSVAVRGAMAATGHEADSARGGAGCSARIASSPASFVRPVCRRGSAAAPRHRRPPAIRRRGRWRGRRVETVSMAEPGDRAGQVGVEPPAQVGSRSQRSASASAAQWTARRGVPRTSASSLSSIGGRAARTRPEAGGERVFQPRAVE